MSDSPPPFLQMPLPPPPPPPPVSPSKRSLSPGWILVLVFAGLVGMGVITLGWAIWTAFQSGEHLLGETTASGPKHLREVVLEDNHSKDKILVLEINGVISGGSSGIRGSLVDSIRDQLDRAEDDEQVKAVVLRVDSPGGEVLASDEIYQELRNFQSSNSIPVVACMGSLAASGGYYVSAPCRWIVAHPLTLTGSIGVIFHGYNYRGLMDKVGIKPDVVKSGKLKDMFSGEHREDEVLPEEKIILKDLVMESFDRFKSVVREGRHWAAEQNRAEGVKDGRELSADWEKLADGRILSGSQALNAGLVDELGNFDKAVDRAMKLAHLESANLVSYQHPHTIDDFLGLWGKTSSGKVRVELPGILPESTMAQGRLYFMSPLHLR